MWRQVELSLDLESVDTVEWGSRWLVSFIAGKTQLFYFGQSVNFGITGIKMDKAVLEEKSSFQLLGVLFTSKLDWGSYIVLNC